MIRGLRKLVNLRSFITTKDTQQLKQEFQKISKQHNEASQSIIEPEEEKIKIRDESEATSELKSKFSGVKEDLGKNTGKAQGVFERAYNAAKAFKMPDISVSDIKSKLSRPPAPAKPNDPPEAKPIDQASSSTDKSEPTATPLSPPSQSTEPPKPKISYYGSLKLNYPRAGTVLDTVSGQFVSLWNETFPKKEQKIDKLKKIHEMRRISREIDEKLARGEITEEEVPQWKKSALMVVENKSKWERLKRVINKAGLNDKISSKTSEILKSDSVKQVRTRIQELKEGITDAKDLVKEAMEDSDSKVLRGAKDIVNSSILETSEAKGIRYMRQFDPEFDIYLMELELTDIVKEIFTKYLEIDTDYLFGICEGQAKEYFKSQIEEMKKNGVKMIDPKVSTSPKCTYLGANTEDKTQPKFSYSFTIIYSTQLSKANPEEEVEEISNHNPKIFKKQTIVVKKIEYFTTFTGHPDPDIEKYGHPWLFLAFQASDGKNKLL